MRWKLVLIVKEDVVKDMGINVNHVFTVRPQSAYYLEK